MNEQQQNLMKCKRCKKYIRWEEMSEDSFLTICNHCDMQEMYEEMKKIDE